MNDISLMIICIAMSFWLCSGEPDLLDALTNNFTDCVVVEQYGKD